MPDAALMAQLVQRLGAEAVLHGDALRGRVVGNWAAAEPLAAGALVRPGSTAEVSEALRLCYGYGQRVVIHGGLTGLVGGAATTPADLVLSLERMRRVERVDVAGRSLTVEAGATLQAVQEAAAEHGLWFPLDLGARGTASIGGNIATNAGGTRVLRYGMARSLVLGLEAVLADGTVVSSMNRMLKNNAGYDIKQLFIGTEGTLGVVTRVVLRLWPQPVSACAAFMAVRGFAELAKLLAFLDQRLPGGLSAFEALWSDFYRFVLETTPGLRPPVAPGAPFYALAEFLGTDPAADAERFAAVLAEACDAGLASEVAIAKSEAERAAFWRLREELEGFRQLRPLLIFDVSLPIEAMPGYADEVTAAIRGQWPAAPVLFFGHLADGNLHIAVSAGPADGAARREVEALVYRPLAGVGGSVSAEHGIGLDKKPYLTWCREGPEVELMRRLKRALDPKGILNAGRVVDT